MRDGRPSPLWTHAPEFPVWLEVGPVGTRVHFGPLANNVSLASMELFHSGHAEIERTERTVNMSCTWCIDHDLRVSSPDGQRVVFHHPRPRPAISVVGVAAGAYIGGNARIHVAGIDLGMRAPHE